MCTWGGREIGGMGCKFTFTSLSFYNLGQVKKHKSLTRIVFNGAEIVNCDFWAASMIVSRNTVNTFT